jgi:hypothetical protein
MESITVVRCPGCGYDGNNPYFRYCGICGTVLQEETRAANARAKPSKAPPLAISSYSILGLQDEPAPIELRLDETHANAPRPDELPYHLRPGHDPEPSRNADYLLQDDEPRSPRWGLYLGLAVLVISAAALAWQWQRYGSPSVFLSAASNSEKRSLPAHEAAAAPDNSLATAAPGVTPAAPAPDSTSVPAKTETPSPQSVPDTQETSAPETKAADSAPPQPANAPEAVAPRQEDRPTTPVANRSGALTTDSKPSASKLPTSNPADSEALPAAQPASTSAADANQLFAEGQKYLYGDGVVKDCGRALQDLRTAAGSNPEAASLLGTMYASGHCVGRNLAPAYRWYARALHREPGNARFQSDLDVLWKQMTPAEKQAALRIAP